MNARDGQLEGLLKLLNEHNVSEFEDGGEELSPQILRIKFFPPTPVQTEKSKKEDKEKPRANLLDEAVKSV